MTDPISYGEIVIHMDATFKIDKGAVVGSAKNQTSTIIGMKMLCLPTSNPTEAKILAIEMVLS